jgi:hypothetical protein
VLLILAAGLALGVGAAWLLTLGYSPELPRQLAESRALVATVQGQNAALVAQQGLVQTQVTDLERRASAAREATDELRKELAGLTGLRNQMIANQAENATVVAEARTSRDAVALFATAEAGRAGQLDELQRRSERLERFVQRLSDISSDAAVDLQRATPTPGQRAATSVPDPTEALPPTATVRPTPATPTPSANQLSPTPAPPTP